MTASTSTTSINDRFGHPAGDEILKLFGCIVIQSLRITDIVGRIGGEEFAAMLPCTVEEAKIAAERVRSVFAEAAVHVDDEAIETTVSIGLASGAAGAEVQALLASADTALYQAKRNGRNRIEGGRRRGADLLDRTRKIAAAKPKLPVRELMQRIQNPEGSEGARRKGPFTIATLRSPHGSDPDRTTANGARYPARGGKPPARSGCAPHVLHRQPSRERADRGGGRAEGQHASASRLPLAMFIGCTR